jgi:hypothetical protein
MSKKHCNEGLDDRCRDQNGQIRAKNGSTLVRTLRDDCAPVRSSSVSSFMSLRTAHRAAQEVLITRAARFAVAT